MALSAKREGVKQVPWFSLTEWHQVYKQVYSNDTVQQCMAYDTLLAWKARMPKLPVGVDCTLSIMQVCLRDREWTPKIDNGELPISYENDLCLMYSTTIMRFLNHISNIGHTKQTSLFQIAKQLNIPEWIVNLRHDAAHGHELPSIGVLRIAINMLLTWLHEEYWVAEARTMEECYINDVLTKEAQEVEEKQAFRDLIELWTAVSLYIHVDYHLVADIPDSQLQETLQDLRSFAINLSQENNGSMESNKDYHTQVPGVNLKKDDKFNLETAQTVILSEISRYLRRKSIQNKEDNVFAALFDTEAFLPNSDIFTIFTHEKSSREESSENVLPLALVMFWKNVIFLLQENGMLESLILRLLHLVNNEEETEDRRSLAALWINSLCHSFIKLDAAHCIARTMEYQLESTNSKVSINNLEQRIKEKTDSTHPQLRNILWLNLSDVIPNCLCDVNFISSLILNANKFSMKFIPSLLELVALNTNEENKRLLINLVNIYLGENSGEIKNETNDVNKRLFTVEDMLNGDFKSMLRLHNDTNFTQNVATSFLEDEVCRDFQWKLAPENYDWSGCPIGILPWQVDNVQILNPLEVSISKCNTLDFESEIIPGIIDGDNLQAKSQINWDNVLRKKRRLKKKNENGNADVIAKRALETVRKVV